MRDDVITELPLLSWRGLNAHCSLAPLEGSHDQAQRRLPYRDGAGHDHTGRAPYRIDAQLFFFETIEAEEFTANLKDWIVALEDGSSDKLVHPLRGPMRARVLHWKINLDARTRSGCIVDVQWEETVDDFDKSSELSALDTDPAAVAAAADDAMEGIIDYPDGKDSNSFLDLINSIKGGIFSVETNLTGKINQAMGIVGGVLDDIDTLTDPKAWAAQANLLALWSSLRAMQDRANNNVARPVAVFICPSDTTLTDIAGKFGNTTEEIMGLNLQLLRSPGVPKGSAVKYYSA